MTLFDFSQSIKALNKEKKFSEALQFFKDNKTEFTPEQIGLNKYIVYEKAYPQKRCFMRLCRSVGKICLSSAQRDNQFEYAAKCRSGRFNWGQGNSAFERFYKKYFIKAYASFWKKQLGAAVNPFFKLRAC